MPYYDHILMIHLQLGPWRPGTDPAPAPDPIRGVAAVWRRLKALVGRTNRGA